jgi:predicted PurR-regulated permease PerM
MTDPLANKSSRLRKNDVPFPLAWAAAWSWRILVIFGAAALIVLVLIELYVVVVPVLLALFIASVLEPGVAWLRRHRWPSTLAATFVFVIALASVVGLGVWIVSSVTSQFSDLGSQVDSGVDSLKKWAQQKPLNLSAKQVKDIELEARNAFGSASGGFASQALSQARTVANIFGGFTLLLFTLFFVMKDGEHMGKWLVARISPAHQGDAVVLTNQARTVMRQYVLATAATGLIDGVLIGIALFALGVPLYIPLAILTFLGGFIPLLGATLAGLISAVVALGAKGPGTALLVVVATIIVQQVEGNILQPLILERAVRLHPLLTVSAVAGGLILGGLLGAFLSVPLVAIGVGVGSYYRNRAEKLANAETDTNSTLAVKSSEQLASDEPSEEPAKPPAWHET